MLQFETTHEYYMKDPSMFYCAEHDGLCLSVDYEDTVRFTGITQKTCRACDTLKDLEDFPLFSTVGAGRKNTCKACSNQLATVRARLRKKNPPPPPGNCPACNRLTSRWVLDHCHHTDQFRGYICNSCNLGFGKFNDDPELMSQALNYLTKPPSSSTHA